eukprot:gnl/TRDRNA2_/TRDRNA2_175026_c0_seq7.p1 gnl/TRDRNA2_/TRDRNA2_175026_c0~~gnl/TRDRNA2_/TRDRNA2_175026_c0_seq7.p1  ORF type:complete len:467 (+),score=130.40 gnl/TRDRNA2_/TRDRNA2_175026_c0_seq7:156-1556(+)
MPSVPPGHASHYHDHHHPHDWQRSVVGNLSKADGAQRKAQNTIEEGLIAVRKTNMEQSRQRDAVHDKFYQKIENTKELSSQLSSRIRSVASTIEHTVWSHEKLQAAIAALQEPLQLIKSRIAMRAKRPKREKVFDSFQEALLREEKELQTAKMHLTNAASDTLHVMQELKARKEDLESDLRDKEHALSIDKSCVDKKTMRAQNLNLDKLYSTGGSSMKMVLPEILMSARGDGTFDSHQASEGRREEAQRQKATLKDIEKALRAEQLAKDRWQTTNVLLENCKKNCDACFKITQAEMGAKIEHTELLRQELVKQRKLTEQKIQHTQDSLAIVNEKLKLIEKPLAATATRSHIRTQRNVREIITDEVSEALREQHEALEVRKMQLQEQAAVSQHTLEVLEDSRQHLLEDIADKDKALAIDRSCAAAKNAAHGDYSFGYSRVGGGEKYFADTASSMKRQVTPRSRSSAQ